MTSIVFAIKTIYSNKFKLFPAYVKFSFNFQHFEKKDEPHSARLSKIIDHERRRFLNV